MDKNSFWISAAVLAVFGALLGVGLGAAETVSEPVAEEQSADVNCDELDLERMATSGHPILEQVAADCCGGIEYCIP